MSHILLSVFLGATAITDVRVEVGDATVLERATVIVDGALITKVGVDLPVPAGATVIDGKGRVLTPGLVESISQLGLSEVALERATNDQSAHGPVVPGFRAAEGYNPLSPRVAITRAGGVTSAIIAPYGALLFGTGSWADLRSELSAAPDAARPVAMFGGLVREGHDHYGARGGQWLALREIFADARAYLANRASYDKGDSRPLSLPPTHLEALAPVLAGSLPLVLWIERASDLLTALRFAKEQKVRLVIAGGSEAWLVAPELARDKVPVLIKPSNSAPMSFDQLAARDDLARLLLDAGVPFAITSSDWDVNVRRLRWEAGWAVAHGLPREQAMRAITSRPAQIFGRKDIGTIAPGARADLVLWSGDPLELTSVAEQVWIGGAPQSLRHRQRLLAERYQERLGLGRRATP